MDETGFASIKTIKSTYTSYHRFPYLFAISSKQPFHHFFLFRNTSMKCSLEYQSSKFAGMSAPEPHPNRNPRCLWVYPRQGGLRSLQRSKNDPALSRQKHPNVRKCSRNTPMVLSPYAPKTLQRSLSKNTPTLRKTLKILDSDLTWLETMSEICHNKMPVQPVDPFSW